MPVNTVLQVDDIKLKLSNLEKMFYSNGFSKSEVIDYYIRIAPALLPHIKDRPMTLKRYPHGADGKFFIKSLARLTNRLGSIRYLFGVKDGVNISTFACLTVYLHSFGLRTWPH